MFLLSQMAGTPGPPLLDFRHTLAKKITRNRLTGPSIPRIWWAIVPVRLAVQEFNASRGPLDAGGGVGVEHELDMADAGVGVAGQVCSQLLRLP